MSLSLVSKQTPQAGPRGILIALCTACVVDSLSTTVTLGQSLLKTKRLVNTLLTSNLRRRLTDLIASRSGANNPPTMACSVCSRMQNSSRSPRNHHHCEVFICTSRRATLSGLPSANLTTTWPGLSRTWMLECSIDKHVSRKKLFVDESRSANLTCNTERLEGRDAIRGPWPLFQPVGRPAPTDPVPF